MRTEERKREISLTGCASNSASCCIFAPMEDTRRMGQPEFKILNNSSGVISFPSSSEQQFSTYIFIKYSNMPSGIWIKIQSLKWVILSTKVPWLGTYLESRRGLCLNIFDIYTYLKAQRSEKLHKGRNKMGECTIIRVVDKEDLLIIRTCNVGCNHSTKLGQGWKKE